MSSYTVKRHKHGIVVEGVAPVRELCALMEVWADRYDTCDYLISSYIGANSVYTTEEGSRKWRRELGIGGEATG